MNMQQDPREASPRAVEGSLAFPTPSRGRVTAPHLSLWLPIAAKAAAAAVGALVLAVIGAREGAHGPRPAFEPAASASPLTAPSAAPAMVAAAMMGGIPSLPIATGGAGAPEPPAEAESAPARDPAPGAGLLADGRVVLNAASESELTKLPGIGPSRARAILELRRRLTKFRAVEDLLRIKGIGRKMLRRLRPSVVLDRPVVDPPGGHAAPAQASPAVEDSAPSDPETRAMAR